MDKFIGKYCVVRGDRSGVFAGTVTAQDGREVTMADVRRLWRWQGATESFGLSATGTTDANNCKFTISVSEVVILDAIEIVPCTEVAAASLKAVKEWTA